MTGRWLDKGRYLLSTVKQGTGEWLGIRKGRIPGSEVGAFCGVSNFKSAKETAEIIAGVKKPEFTEDAIERMNYGTIMEPVIRKWYERTQNITVEEVGVAIPKWDPRFCSSLDGVLPDGKGCIEIKNTKNMYKPLIEYCSNTESTPKNFSHIWPTHFYQMQFGMAVNDKEYCDYIVASIPEKKVFKQRIFFDREFFEGTMLPQINLSYSLYLEPLLKERGIVLSLPVVS